MTRISEAMEALVRGDYVTARNEFEVLAAIGSKRSLLALGNIYERGGPGVPQDFSAARIWYGRAFADAHSVMAALGLGRLHYFGLGGPIDYEKAYFYYSKLEYQNQPIALYRLGIMSELGKGTVRDAGQARQLYRRAARLKNIHARKNWSVIEIKSGKFLFGSALWLYAVVQGIFLYCIKPNDPRLRTR